MELASDSDFKATLFTRSNDTETHKGINDIVAAMQLLCNCV